MYQNRRGGDSGGGNNNQPNHYSQPKSYLQNIEQQLQSQSRKTQHRRIIDHGNPIGRWIVQRSMGIAKPRLGTTRPEASYLIDLLPPAANKNKNPILDVQTKFVHLSANKAKHSINTVKWTPEGRRLISANYAGEFTLWNGMTFNFETIMQAHDSSIHSMCYSHNDDWLISGDQEGVIKFWQPNFNNVNLVKAHVDSVRDLAFSPNDSRFVSCSDDRFLKIWNFTTGQEERTLKGHNWDVKCCDWHPDLGLIVSGSKDNLIKLWDPRSPTCVNTILGFKHIVVKTKFQPSGTARLIASVSKDRSCRIFDLRTMKDLLIIRSHEADLSSVAWNPAHSNMLSTGGFDGSINHYLLNSHQLEDLSNNNTENETKNGDNNSNGNNKDNNFNQSAPSIDPCHVIPYAHEKGVSCLEYHPLGHVLCSAGADRSARFWCRSRPNDPHAFNDELYTNNKIGAWHYAINNNVNAVRNIDDKPSVPDNSKMGRSDTGENNRQDYANINNNFNGNNNRRPQQEEAPRPYLPGLGKRR